MSTGTENAANETATQTTAKPAASMLDAAIEETIRKQSIKWTVADTGEELDLSISHVRKLFANPTRSGAHPTDKDCWMFLQLCKARGLNPYVGDAFLVGYDSQSEGPTFSLITSHQALLKRAEGSGKKDGMESGVIVLTADGQEKERQGDFYLDGMEKLVGGWAKVYRNDWKYPAYERLTLQSRQKGFGRWRVDPAGMIVKCAEAAAHRMAFPRETSEMYIREELDTIKNSGHATDAADNGTGLGSDGAAASGATGQTRTQALAASLAAQTAKTPEPEKQTEKTAETKSEPKPEAKPPVDWTKMITEATTIAAVRKLVNRIDAEVEDAEKRNEWAKFALNREGEIEAEKTKIKLAAEHKKKVKDDEEKRAAERAKTDRNWPLLPNGKMDWKQSSKLQRKTLVLDQIATLLAKDLKPDEALEQLKKFSTWSSPRKADFEEDDYTQIMAAMTAAERECIQRKEATTEAADDSPPDFGDSTDSATANEPYTQDEKDSLAYIKQETEAAKTPERIEELRTMWNGDKDSVSDDCYRDGLAMIDGRKF